jgi:hypothetical protein
LTIEVVPPLFTRLRLAACHRRQPADSLYNPVVDLILPAEICPRRLQIARLEGPGLRFLQLSSSIARSWTSAHPGSQSRQAQSGAPSTCGWRRGTLRPKRTPDSCRLPRITRPASASAFSRGPRNCQPQRIGRTRFPPHAGQEVGDASRRMVMTPQKCKMSLVSRPDSRVEYD